MGKLKSNSASFSKEYYEHVYNEKIELINECIDDLINTSKKTSFEKISIEKYKEISELKKDRYICYYNDYILDNVEKYYKENNIEYKLIINEFDNLEIGEIEYCYTVVYINE